MSSFPTELANLARAIRRLRKPTGLSQERFASSIKLHRTQIGALERGKGNPTLETLCAVADGLGISVAELFAVAAGKEGELVGSKAGRRAKRGASRVPGGR